MKITRALAAAALSMTLVAGLASCGTDQQSSTEATDKLELISWWTSGSEQEALDVLIDGFKAKNPDVEVVNAPVVGGGGSNAQVVLAQRLLAGDPPDTWQTFPSAALQSYVAQRQVADVSEVLQQSGMSTKLPQVILDGLTVDGKQYGVPTSSHRGNMLFFNTDVLRKAGVIKGKHPVKVLGDGELTSALTVHAHKFSKSAQEKITKAGGKFEVL